MRGYYPFDASIVRVTGEKAGAFLNGQFTNDVKNLKKGEANYNLFLTQKGKIVADLTVHRLENDFLLLIPKAFVSKVTGHISRLAPLSRVTLTDETEKCVAIHVIFPAEQRVWFDKLTMSGRSHPFPMNRIGLSGTDWIVPKNDEKKLLEILRQNGLTELDPQIQEIIRLENGIARVGVDATEDNLPQEANLLQAINFAKGCYLGQEVVARLHYRGHVNKILVGLKCEGERPSVGDPIFSTNKEVGKITSVVLSPKLGAPLALGYVPYAEKNLKTRFQIGRQKKTDGIVVRLPLSVPTSP